MPALAIAEITASEDLEALVPEWHELWSRVPTASPVQSPAWLIPWWREIGGGALWVLTARAGGRLVGLLPMYRQHATLGAKLLPLGIAISDYLDGLFEEDIGPIAAEAMLRRLAERDDWERCELHPLRAGSPLLEAPAPPGFTDELLAFEPCPGLEIPAGTTELGELVPSKIRRNLGYFRRRAEQAGRISFETATAATLSEFLEALFCLHEARWRRLDHPGVLADPTIRRFHPAAAPLLLASGMLRPNVLRLDERIIATLYVLCAKRRVCFYLIGVDPEFGTISPGTLVLGHSIQQAVREGAREVDFLRGQERYKYFWGARDRPCYGRMLNLVG